MEKSTEKSYFIRRIKLCWKRNYAWLTMLLVIPGLWFYALHIEPDSLKITEYTFVHPAIPPEMDGYRIAFAADIHYNTRRIKLWKKAIDKINQNHVDLILLGGDFINGNGKGLKIEKFLTSLKELKNPDTIYCVNGNHEYRYRHGGIKTVRKAFAAANITLLQDEVLTIKTAHGGKFNLIGLNFKTNPHDRQNIQHLKRLFRQDTFNLVLTHTPEDFAYLPENAHLILAGHTHGGQINIPGMGSIINPPGCDRFESYGKVVKNNQTMFITSGIGSAYTQARFFMKPEIVFITLKSNRKK